MRRTLLAAPATLIAIAALAGPAAAEPPVHEREIAKDVEATIPPPPECTGPATALDLSFHLQSHAIFTPTSFHFTGTNNGTWTARDENGAMTAGGHFAGHFSAQGPGEPTLVITDLTNATGKTIAGQHTNFHFLAHLTVTPDGEARVDFEGATCVP